MGKYTPLRDYLTSQARDHVPMTFKEIEAVIGETLPSSKQYPAWWSNNSSNNVMTKEWLAAGYETEQVDIGGEKLVFRRTLRNGGVSKKNRGGISEATGNGKERLDQLLKRMGGLLKGAKDYDPAASLDDEWPEPYLGTEKT